MKTTICDNNYTRLPFEIYLQTCVTIRVRALTENYTIFRDSNVLIL